MGKRGLIAVAIVIIMVAAAIPGYYFANTIINKPKIGNPSETLIGMEYETWFPYPMGWNLREATPLLGTYNSSNPAVIEQQAEWLTWAGVNFIVIDWSNNVWQSSPSSRDNWHTFAFAIINSTSALLREYYQMTLMGLPHPKVTILVGLDNGPSANITELNEEAKWVYWHYVENPAYNQSLLYYEGKPLLLVLDTAMVGGWSDPNFTVRYMGAQLQATGDSLGYWSWIDGSINPVVAYRGGYPEAVTVTPAFFDPGGWLATGAVGRRNGATYIQEWNAPLKYKPKFILICQWNEFAGQPNDSSIYTDCYSVQYSNDIEPTQLDGWGYRGKGGWGYYYLVLTKALIELYRGDTPGATVMAISNPINGGWVASDRLNVTWTYIGKAPSSYTILLDGKVVAKDVQGIPYRVYDSNPNEYMNMTLLSYSSNLSGLPIRQYYTVTVIANGAKSYFNLTAAYSELVNQSITGIPCESTVSFFYNPIS